MYLLLQPSWGVLQTVALSSRSCSLVKHICLKYVHQQQMTYGSNSLPLLMLLPDAVVYCYKHRATND